MTYLNQGNKVIVFKTLAEALAAAKPGDTIAWDKYHGETNAQRIDAEKEG